MNEWIRRGVAAAVGGYGVALGSVFAGQRRLMYFPD